MRFPFWAGLVTLISVLILCALGVWQLERLTWKREVLAQMDREYALDAAGVSLSVQDFEIPVGYKRGFIEGIFKHEAEILIQPRLHEGKLGYHIITPFLPVGESRYVLVNRGWIPIERERDVKISIGRPEGIVRVIGMLRPVSKGNWFTPKNEPIKGQWYAAIPQEIFAAKDIEGVGARILYAEGESAGVYPLPDATKIALNNNHAQYAAFWFSLAVILLGVFWIRFVRKPMK